MAKATKEETKVIEMENKIVTRNNLFAFFVFMSTSIV